MPWVIAIALACVAGRGAKAAGPVHTVFVIAFENHNWTQPPGGTPAALFENPNAPFINSLVKGTSPYSRQAAYATQYHNAGATPTGAGALDIHPSELSYIWSEAGSSLGVRTDKDPYGPDGNNRDTTQHLSTYLTKAGVSWKSYQEGIDTDAAGNVLPRGQWTVPLRSKNGKYTAAANPATGSKHWAYGAKHNPMLFFSDTNGGNNASNPARFHYAPLQQLYADLTNNTVPRYSWITPDLYDDMHSSLPGGYKSLKGDDAAIKQGDDFLAMIVPKITASKAYKNNGAIIIWYDETEGGERNDYNHTIPEIIISPLAHANVGGVPYSNAINYTHSSDLKTMQEIFGVGPYLGDAGSADTHDLRDLFVPGAIPDGIR
jgi:phospholipase C